MTEHRDPRFVTSDGPIGGSFYAARTPSEGLILMTGKAFNQGVPELELTEYQAMLLATILPQPTPPKKKWWQRRLRFQ